MTHNTIRVVAIGGSPGSVSSTEKALRQMGAKLEASGAIVSYYCGDALALAHYGIEPSADCVDPSSMIEDIRHSDAVIIGSPGYHGGVSGLVKNAIDHMQELVDDARPYLDGRPVACVATAGGYQAGAATLSSLRASVHALRGWPIPMGVVINTQEQPFDESGFCHDRGVCSAIEIACDQILTFATRWNLQS